MISKLHHVQITIPTSAEEQAREFYCGVLGLTEMAKPMPLSLRGGFWLQLGEQQVHVGLEDNIDRASSRTHVAYEVSDLEVWRERLALKGVSIIDGQQFPGYRRFEFRDPFGNRIELLKRQPDEGGGSGLLSD